MDPILPLFLLNIPVILLNASLGWFMAPRLVSAVEDPEIAGAGIRGVRKLLPGIVALYMFFNCLGYFQERLSYLLAVSGLVLADLALQLVLRRRTAGNSSDSGE